MKISHIKCVVAGLLSIALTDAAVVQAATPVIPSNAIFDALQKGDAADVRRQEQVLGAGPSTRAMDDAQLRYDLPALMREAHACELSNFAKATQPGLLGSLRCNVIVRASALSLGDAKSFLKEALWARTTLFPALSQSFGDHASFDNGLDTADLAGLAARTAAIESAWRSEDALLAFQDISGLPANQAVPKPSIHVGDQSIPVALASDRSTPTPLWVVVSPADADATIKKLGLTALVPSIQAATAALRGQTYPVHVDLYLAKSITVGNLELRNAAVGVVKTDYLPPGIQIGVSLLSRFGEVTLDHKGIKLVRQTSSTCTDGAPMSFAAGPSLDGYETFDVSMGGKAVRTVFDPASPTWLELSASLGIPAPQDGQAKINIGSWNSRIQTTAPPVWSRPQEGLLGNNLLKTNTVKMQFGSSPMICVSGHA